jgi:DNA-binding GntR family transcriptional regulator
VTEQWSQSRRTGADGYRTMADIAYDELRRRILSGDLPAGSRIDQDAEAERLRSSRMPIREALRRLGAEGLVDIAPHRGAVVRALSAADLEDLYVMRLALEGVAGRLGAEQHSPEDLELMRQMLPAMEEVVARDDPVAWLELDWSFHRTLYLAAQRPRLLQTIHQLREEARRYRTVGLSLPRVLEVSLHEHRAMIEACERKDGEEVEVLIRQALERTRSELRVLLEQGVLPAESSVPAR